MSRQAAIAHIEQRANEIAARTAADLKRTMADSAHELFVKEIRPTMLELALTLRSLCDRTRRPWVSWLTHAATAAFASAGTLALVVWLPR